MKTIRFACAVVLSAASAIAAELPQPWAHWIPENGYDAVLTEKGEFSYYKYYADDSGNGHVLTADGSSGATVATNAFRSAVFKYAGSGGAYAHFTCPKLKSRTMAFWVNLTAGNANNYPTKAEEERNPYLLNGFSGLSVSGPWLGGWTQAVYTVALDGVATSVSTKFPRSQWCHVAVTLEDTGSVRDGKSVFDLKLYKDGVCVSSQDGIAASASEAGECFVGNNKTWSSHSISGFLDDVFVYDRALSADDVSLLYNRTRQNTLLIGHWPMERIDDDGNGNRTTPDVSGAGNPMSVGPQNLITNGVVGAGSLFFDAGPVDDAIDNCWASTAIRPRGLEGDLSIALWVKRDRGYRNYNSPRFVKCPYGGILYLADVNYPDLWDSKTLGTESSVKIPNAVARAEEWSHLVIMLQFERMQDDKGEELINASSIPKTRARYVVYRNGKLVWTGDWTADDKSSISKVGGNLWPNGTAVRKFIFGNGGDTIGSGENCRPIRGSVDDLRLYAGRLTEEEIAELSRGPARVDAGADFTVAGETGDLHGTISDYSSNLMGVGFAGEQTWSLVSAPVGGEGAAIANPRGATTRVTLPAEGTYVFRLTSVAAGSSYSDEVTVVRDDSASGVPPAPSPTVTSQSGLGAVVSAGTVGARVKWSLVSGPGGAWFANPCAEETVVTFGAAGEYVIRCTACTSGGETSADVAITASGNSIEAQLAQGLRAYWPIEVEDALSDGTTVFSDTVAGRKLKSSGGSFGGGFGMDAGVGGSYAMRLQPTKAAYATTSGTDNPLYHSEGQWTDKAAGTHKVPQEPFLTISCWLYHDGGDTNEIWMGTIMESANACGVLYHCDNGAGNDIELVQQEDTSVKRRRFQGPDLNFTNRWVHLVAQLDQHDGKTSSVWINGRKLEYKSGVDLTFGRYIANRVPSFGGNSSYKDPDLGNDETTSHRFPGFMDEIRIYSRELTDTEIKYLAAYPVPSALKRAPSVTVPLADIVLAKRDSSTLTAAAYADRALAGANLKFTWRVLTGDAAKLVFSDPTALCPVITAKGTGEFALQLEVEDGERTAWSEPVRVSVPVPGLLIFVK